MSSEQKDLSQLTNEELMEIAKLPVKEDKDKNLPPVKRFIIADGLEDGEDLIPASLLYYRYQQYAKNFNILDIGNVRFYRELKLYYPKIRKTNGFYYKLSSKGFDLSEEFIDYVNSKIEKRISRGKPKKKSKKAVQT